MPARRNTGIPCIEHRYNRTIHVESGRDRDGGETINVKGFPTKLLVSVNRSDHCGTMKAVLLAILLCTIGLAFADVASKFEEAKIKPDILNEVPQDFIEVKYGEKRVELGNEFLPVEASNVPEIHFNHTGGLLYTLALTDADVPTRGYNREFNHWLVGNIPEDTVSKGEIIAEYFGPAPPVGTGKHRYVFLLYKQNQGAITFDERRLSVHDVSQRKRFSIRKFVEKYNLEGPLAGNFFRAQFDDAKKKLTY